MSYYVTFYSYKGGVGRTLTLVNVAVSLVRYGHSVFIWELDLEAPGLLHMPFFEPLRKRATGGTVDLIAAYPQADPSQELSRYVLEHPEFEPGRLRLLPAGCADTHYAERFAAIR
jgi:MinD-like ATPase involved in chromosome partitioning or flagellar assembly